MHGDPGRAWHLKELARACAMSRDDVCFPLHHSRGGCAADLSYRMAHAPCRARLARGGDPGARAVGQSVGYASESAFSNAFKRVTGIVGPRYTETRNQFPLRNDRCASINILESVDLTIVPLIVTPDYART